MRGDRSGFTLVELMVSLTVIAVISVGFFSLFIALVHSTTVAKQQAVASTLATNQMEYLRSLSYDSLAVSGGSIISSSYIPAVITKKLNGITYTITTSISYVDDAYDGCGPYPTADFKKKYCRNYLHPGNANAINNVDTNPADYKIAHVAVTNRSGTRLATVDTQISARVSETANTTGALFVTVTDPSGTAVPETTITVTNSTINPNVSVSDTTDSNGLAIFYGLPPDFGQDYVIKATKAGYSTVNSISPSGSLQPTYINQKILSQQSSYLALVVGKMAANSLVIETTDTSGLPLANMKVYLKGGYKKYTLLTDESYYNDTLTPADSRPISNNVGIATVMNLPPINGYLFCGTNGATGCAIGATTYYLAAALPYGGNTSFSPIVVPENKDSSLTLFDQDGSQYVQKVRLLLTPNSSFPRVSRISPDTINLSDNLKNVKFVISGYNLTNASATLAQNGITYTDSHCVGSTTQLTCSYDLSTAVVGELQLSVQNSSGTLLLPTVPKGGVHVAP